MNRQSWKLTFESSLRADAGARFAPGQGPHRRWLRRFLLAVSACDNVEVLTDQARGEGEVHGTVAWVAWSADFAAGPTLSGPATIVIAAPGAAEAGEPWFVRVRSTRIGFASTRLGPSCRYLQALCSAAVSTWRLLTAD